MIAPAKKKVTASFPGAKIKRAVETALPKGKTFKLRIVDSKIGEKKIVRVVTPAWKTLRPADRIGKILDAMEGKLTTQEQKRILRVSVLTPQEYDSIVLGRRVKSRTSLVHR
jgi:hypothetical protein